MAKCIYCFLEFEPIEAHFRAEATIEELISATGDKEDLIFGGSTINETKKDDRGRVLDERLKNYFINKLDKDEITASNDAYLLPWFTIGSKNVIVKKEEDKETKKIYVPRLFFDPLVYKSTKMSTNERLCPHCHNKLPIGFGIKDTLIISIIGDTFSGKTVYLTVLIKELLKGTNAFDASLIPIGEKNILQDYINNYTQKIYVEKRLPQASPVQILPPLIYNYTYSYLNEYNNKVDKSINVVLYDIAGENCREKTTLDKKGLNVKNSDGIILLLNPLAINNISNYYTSEGMVTGDTTTESQYEIISALYDNFLGEDNKKSTIPIACVISKADIFLNEEVKLPFFDSHPYSKVLTKNYNGETKHNGYLDKDDIESLSYDVEEFLKWTQSNEFLAAIKKHFENFNFFSMSALNQMPVRKLIDGIEKSVIAKEIKPFRVVDPFYWILSQNKYLLRRNETNIKPKKSGFFSNLFKN